MQEAKRYQVFNQEISKYQKPPLRKESFEFIKQLIKRINPSSVVDIGCANGDFLFNLSDGNPIRSVGIDKSSELIEIAKGRNQHPEKIGFFSLDVISQEDDEQFREILREYGEVVTIIGTIQSFLDFRPLLDKILSNQSTKTIIIHSAFNDDPLDVQVFHRDLTLNETEFQAARTFFAKRTVSEYLQKKGITDFVFLPFCMEETLYKDQKYPNRNYHLFTRDGDKLTTNGSMVLFKKSTLVIKK